LVGHPISDRLIIVGENHHGVVPIAVEIKASIDSLSGGTAAVLRLYGVRNKRVPPQRSKPIHMWQAELLGLPLARHGCIGLSSVQTTDS